MLLTTHVFQSPCGGKGTSDVMKTAKLVIDNKEFQSPYGGIGASDFNTGVAQVPNNTMFQSPYGGIGASDSVAMIYSPKDTVSITLRWQG